MAANGREFDSDNVAEFDALTLHRLESESGPNRVWATVDSLTPIGRNSIRVTGNAKFFVAGSAFPKWERSFWIVC
jgi:hypothetical protein